MIGIYVHIPFCESKCIYCDFASFVCAEQEKYFSFLLQEINNSENKGQTVDTIYFGGGTPSVVEPKYIADTLDAIRKNFEVLKDSEITIECNPNSVTPENLDAYHSIGFNRISFGVQSLNDDVLKFLGRKHRRSDALLAIENAKKVGFKNISADLIVGLPKVSSRMLCSHAKKLIDMGVTHISSYMLQVEEGTPLFKMCQENPQIFPVEDDCAESFSKLVLLLSKYNFNQYEVSNFARIGFESRHNLKYWSGENYLGFGLSATSTYGNRRWTNGGKFETYFKGKKEVEFLGNREKIEEKIMLGLRCYLGFDIKEIEKLGYKISEKEDFETFLKKGIIYEKEGKIYLNPKFYSVNNQIISKLLP